MKPIEHYTDYRQFLKDFYADRKRRSATFSHRQFCLKAGIRSPSLLREVSEGRRNLTESSTQQFIKGLGLTETDAKYFASLVQYNQTQDPVARQQWLDSLRGLQQRVQAKFVPLDRHEFYSRWYLPVLRELAVQRSWGRDFGALAQAVRPAITETEAEQGIELLERMGFLETFEAGWIQPDPALTTGSEVDSMAVRSGNRQFAELGFLSIEEVPPTQRDVSTMVLGVGKDGFRRIKEEIRLFKERVARIAEDDKDADRVFALNVQLVPHSSSETKDD